MKAYKAFNKDFKCRDSQYEVNSEFETFYEPNTAKIELCINGLHCCKKMIDVFNYYPRHKNTRVCEVEVIGDEFVENGDKLACREIKIIRELSQDEINQMTDNFKFNSGDSNSGNYNSGDDNSGNFNSGHNNSGYFNSGNWNSGNWNSGISNSGNWNSGNWNSGISNSGNWNSGNWNSGISNSGDNNSGDNNSGNYNSGDYNSGYFNTDEPTIRMFNKDTGLTRNDIDLPYVSLDLKGKTYHEAWKISWDKLDEYGKDRFKNLPNFDSKTFKEITGIEIEHKRMKLFKRIKRFFRGIKNLMRDF